MSRIKLQNENSNNPEVKKVFDEIRMKTGGTIPAAYRVFGLQPHILQANWNRTKRILSEGNLPHSLKESIALTVSNANGCHFCVAIHKNNLLKQGFSEDEVNQIMESNSKDEKIDFILKFCVKATKDPRQVNNSDFEQLRNFGYSDEDILEILTTMEMYTGYNKIIVALDLQLDD
ncbi:MAG: peroxidase-related enzyme [bacterium]